LLVVLDDATSEIYYAQLVEEESTRTVLAALREVVERRGVFCALYSDRASHFFETPQAGGKIDPRQLTQVGRALQELGIPMIPAYSPQARGRSERNFGTWQGRLPQELRLRGIHTLEAANQFLREDYVAEFNQRFRVPAGQRVSALSARRPGLCLLAPADAHRGGRQHGERSESVAADRTHRLARQFGRMPGHGARASGWHSDHPLRTACRRKV
jgi:hypothetical protein